MRQRLHLAVGLLGSPSLLLLDEPTIGLDPPEAERVRRTVREVRATGTCILLTSHYLQDVQKLADRVLGLADGRLVADMSLDEFSAGAGYIARATVRGRGARPDPAALPAGQGGEHRVEVVDHGGGAWTATLWLRQWDTTAVGSLSTLLQTVDVLDLTIDPASLEDAYSEIITTRDRV